MRPPPETRDGGPSKARFPASSSPVRVLGSRRRLLWLLLLAAASAALLAWVLLAGGPGAQSPAHVSLAAAGRGSGRPPGAAGRALSLQAQIRALGSEPQWSQGRVLVRGAWGAGPGQFGRRREAEAAPEAPMGLAVDGRGGIHILDQVNGRVQRFGPDGRPGAVLRISSPTAQDLVVDRKGRTLVLDRLGEGGVEILDADGRSVGQVPVGQDLVHERGGITGLFAQDDGLYVESEHHDLVRIADSSGRPAEERQTLPGRPTRDGRFFIRAGVIDKSEGRVYVQANERDGSPAWETPISLTRPVLHLLLLDSDLAGRVYLAAEVGLEDPLTLEMVELATVVLRLDRQGHLNGVLALPPTTAEAEETFRPLAVGDDGTIYHMVPSSSGITVTAYRF